MINMKFLMNNNRKILNIADSLKIIIIYLDCWNYLILTFIVLLKIYWFDDKFNSSPKKED